MPTNIKSTYISLLSKKNVYRQGKYELKEDPIGRLTLRRKFGFATKTNILWSSDLWHRKYKEYAQNS